eukprot:scaffold11635_cov107-Isochrysis_galbana.AAC.2
MGDGRGSDRTAKGQSVFRRVAAFCFLEQTPGCCSARSHVLRAAHPKWLNTETGWGQREKGNGSEWDVLRNCELSAPKNRSHMAIGASVPSGIRAVYPKLLQRTCFEEADAGLAATGEAPPYELAALADEGPPNRKLAADGLTAAAAVVEPPVSEMLSRKPLPVARRDGEKWDSEAIAPAADGGAPTPTRSPVGSSWASALPLTAPKKSAADPKREGDAGGCASCGDTHCPARWGETARIKSEALDARADGEKLHPVRLAWPAAAEATGESGASCRPAPSVGAPRPFNRLSMGLHAGEPAGSVGFPRREAESESRSRKEDSA